MLENYVEGFWWMEERVKETPFEKHLSVELVKPYVQYLCKLCMLNMPEEPAKDQTSEPSQPEKLSKDDTKGKENLKADNDKEKPDK
jgi:hypothetical protein